MPILPAAPPIAVPQLSGFDYVVIDAARRRVYAAHTGSQALLIVDADTGTVKGQVRTGPLQGIAVDPATGHVFTGNGDGDSVSEIDPVALAVLHTTDVAGHVDAIAYDPSTKRIFADEDDGTRVFVVDATTMNVAGTVAVPGHKPEYLALDDKAHVLFQNISDLDEFVTIDPATLRITSVVKTPAISGNHPLQYDPAYDHVLVGGKNGTFAAYMPNGRLVGTVAIQHSVDQCSLDPASHLIACAGSGELTVIRDNPNGAPTLVARAAIDAHAHTVAVDPTKLQAWVVWAGASGDEIQPFSIRP